MTAAVVAQRASAHPWPLSGADRHLTLLTAPALSVGHDILLALAGLGAGLVNGIAGGGTLVSFPALLALGYPALTANVTSTVGIWPGYVSGTAGFHREVLDQADRVRSLALVAMLGAATGAVLLLTTPAKTFAVIVPWLLIASCILFAGQPWLARILNQPELHEHRPRQGLLFGGTFLAAVYGGYFGAGMGVVLLAVLGLALPDSLLRTSGLRVVLSLLINGIAAAVFIVHSPIVWPAAGLLAIGSLTGGYIGARIARWVPTPVLRTGIVAIGLATAIRLLVA